MVEMLQYKRQDSSKDICSSVFVSLHLGFQVVVWSLTNNPKVRMKMVWFYILEQSLQPFSLTELQPLKL